MKAFAKSLSVYLLAICFFMAVVGMIFFDNIKGYYKFKEYCEKEGGLKIYEPLEKNVGWFASDKYDARQTAGLDHVGFVRYEDATGLVDVSVVGSKNKLTLNFSESPANIENPVFYQLKIDSISGKGGSFPGKTSYMVLDKNDKKLTIYNVFRYGFFNSEKMPMNVNKKFSCFEDTYSTGYQQKWEIAISSSFKK